MTRELHIATTGLIRATAGQIQPTVEIAVYRSDGEAIWDALQPTIDLLSGGIYQSPVAINTAIVGAVQAHLITAWGVPASYDAVYFYGSILSAQITAGTVRKTADSTLAGSLSDLPIGASGAPAMAFTVTAGKVYAFRFNTIISVSSLLATVGLTVTVPSFTRFSARAVFTGQGNDGTDADVTGAITTSGDVVSASSALATGTDHLFTVEGLLAPSANGSITLQGQNTGLGTATMRAGSIGTLQEIQ